MLKRVRFLWLGLLFVFLTGCATSAVPLTYAPSKEEVIPIAGAPTISVVTFTDARTETAVGIRSDGTAFTADGPVADWVSQALATELTRLGYVVTFAPTEAQAKRSGATYVVTGKVEEVWLTEVSSTSYEGRMRVAVQLHKNQLQLMKNTFNSSLTRRVVPLSSVPKEVLAETLRDLVTPMTLAIRQKISQ